MEIVTKQGSILGEENRNTDAMAAFYFNKLLTTLEWSNELVFAVYSFIDKDTVSKMESGYMELLSDSDRLKLSDIKAIHKEILKKFGRENGIKKIALIFTPYWEKYIERFTGFKPFKYVAPLLKKTYKLSDLEINILKIIYVEDKVSSFSSFFSELSFSQYIEVLAIIFDVEVGKIRYVLENNQKLIKLDLIDLQDFFPQFLTLKPVLLPLFSGVKMKDLSIGLEKSINEKTFALESFPLPKNEVHIIKNLLKKPEPVNLLFYGEPGTGKSAFAHSLAEEVERPVYTFDIMKSGSNYDGRPFSILSSLNHLPKNAILLIDEADRFLKSEGYAAMVDKAWLVSFLDHNNISAIWIVNDLLDIHNAVKRRFVFSKEFKIWNKEARTKLWESLVSTSSISKEFSIIQVENFARRYQLNAGNISSSIEAVSKLYKGGSIQTEDIASVLEKILGESNRIIEGKSVLNKSKKFTPYDPGVINSDQDILPIKDSLMDFIKIPESERLSGINILFWGAPGTGKTAAAKYIGNEMGVVINEQKASELMGSLIGETEKNIGEYFRGMTGDSQVALLDEADSFFLNRSTARNAWERLQTNELLTQMENHTGILFCCTNDLKSLDPAALRRFTWKIEFSAMDKFGVKELFEKYFPVSDKESFNWEYRLEQLKGVTPGDFGILWRRYNIIGNKIPGIDVVLEDLEKELGYRQEHKAVIGF